MNFPHGRQELLANFVPLALLPDRQAANDFVKQALRTSVRDSDRMTVVAIREPNAKPSSDDSPCFAESLTCYLYCVAGKLALMQIGSPVDDYGKAMDEFAFYFSDSVEQSLAYISNLFNKESKSSRTVSQTILKEHAQAELLNSVFGHFCLDTASMTKLDEALGGLICRLSKNAPSNEATLKHVFLVHQNVPDVSGCGYSKHIHVMYLTVDGKSWAESTSKSSSEYVNVNIEMLHHELVIDSERLNTAREKLEDYSQSVAQEDVKIVSGMIPRVEVTAKE